MSNSGGHRGWAVGIIVGIVLFVTGILILVFMSMSREVDLVTDHYYDNELRYQERIQALERGSRPDAAIAVEEKADRLDLKYPSVASSRQLTGSLTLYRPADHSLDRTIAIQPDDSLRQSIPTVGLIRGLWRLKMEWRVNGVEYYAERAVMLQ